MTEEEELDFGEDELFDSNYSPSRASPAPAAPSLSDSQSRRTAVAAAPLSASIPTSARSAVSIAFPALPAPPAPAKENPNLFDSDGRRLPPHWLSKLSATTGNTYYKDTRTGASHWEIPQAEWDLFRESDTPPLEDPTPSVPSLSTATTVPTSTAMDKANGSSDVKSNVQVMNLDRDREDTVMASRRDSRGRSDSVDVSATGGELHKSNSRAPLVPQSAIVGTNTRSDRASSIPTGPRQYNSRPVLPPQAMPPTTAADGSTRVPSGPRSMVQVQPKPAVVVGGSGATFERSEEGRYEDRRVDERVDERQFKVDERAAEEKRSSDRRERERQISPPGFVKARLLAESRKPVRLTGESQFAPQPQRVDASVRLSPVAQRAAPSRSGSVNGPAWANSVAPRPQSPVRESRGESRSDARERGREHVPGDRRHAKEAKDLDSSLDDYTRGRPRTSRSRSPSSQPPPPAPIAPSASNRFAPVIPIAPQQYAVQPSLDRRVSSSRETAAAMERSRLARQISPPRGPAAGSRDAGGRMVPPHMHVQQVLQREREERDHQRDKERKAKPSEEREREREKEREREREKDRAKDREREREKDQEREREKDREIEREREHRERERARERAAREEEQHSRRRRSVSPIRRRSISPPPRRRSPSPPPRRRSPSPPPRRRSPSPVYHRRGRSPTPPPRRSRSPTPPRVLKHTLSRRVPSRSPPIPPHPMVRWAHPSHPSKTHPRRQRSRTRELSPPPPKRARSRSPPPPLAPRLRHDSRPRSRSPPPVDRDRRERSMSRDRSIIREGPIRDRSRSPYSARRADSRDVRADSRDGRADSREGAGPVTFLEPKMREWGGARAGLTASSFQIREGQRIVVTDEAFERAFPQGGRKRDGDTVMESHIDITKPSNPHPAALRQSLGLPATPSLSSRLGTALGGQMIRLGAPSSPIPPPLAPSIPTPTIRNSNRSHPSLPTRPGDSARPRSPPAPPTMPALDRNGSVGRFGTGPQNGLFRAPPGDIGFAAEDSAGGSLDKRLGLRRNDSNDARIQQLRQTSSSTSLGSAAGGSVTPGGPRVLGIKGMGASGGNTPMRRD